MSRTIEQLRAAHALNAVEDVLRSYNDSDGDKKKQQTARRKRQAYRSAARSLPAQLMMQGLGQTLALLGAEGAPVCGLYVTLEDWLKRPGGPYAGSPDVLAAITTKNQNLYIAAQAETVKLAGWLKKFAAALIVAPATTPSADDIADQSETPAVSEVPIHE